METNKMRLIDPVPAQVMTQISNHQYMYLLTKINASGKDPASTNVAYVDRFFRMRIGELQFQPVGDLFILKLHILEGRDKGISVPVNWDGVPLDPAADAPLNMRGLMRGEMLVDQQNRRLKIRSWHFLEDLDSKYIRELGERYKGLLNEPQNGIHKGTREKAT
jgi:hypothetical protein